MRNGQKTFNKEDLLERVLDFSVKIIKLVGKLPKTSAGLKIGSQLVGSATSIGANTQEAQDASSKPDFINKMNIALREAKESKYWLKLIKRSNLLSFKDIDPELLEADELCAIYSTIVKKAKLNLSNVKSQLSNVKGFTLIELLVAITIIGIISSFGILKFMGGQQRARDVERKAHLSQFAAALENYYNDKGMYVSGDTCTFYTQIAPYMKTLKTPYDPLFTSSGTCPSPTGKYYSYQTAHNGKSYRLFAKLENCNDSAVINKTTCASDQYNYTVTSGNLTPLAFGSLPPPSTPPPPTPSSTPTTIPTPTSSPAPTLPPGSPPIPASTAYKRVFVTSTLYTGNLGGLTGADAKCQTRADARNLGGSWKAWLSDNTDTALIRLNHATVPYRRLDNTTVANNWTDLTTHTTFPFIQTPIRINEFMIINTQVRVWTASKTNGALVSSTDWVAGITCNEWTTSSTINNGVGGFSNLNTSSWTEADQFNCSLGAALYCFEQ